MTLGSVILPGVAMVSYNGDQNWVEANNQGSDAASVTNKGRKLHRFSVVLRMAGPYDWSHGSFNPTAALTGAAQDLGWVEAVKALNLSQVGKLKTPFQCSHPLLATFGVTAVVVGTVAFPAGNARDVFTATIQLIEYQAPKPVITGPPAPTLGAGYNGTPVPSHVP